MTAPVCRGCGVELSWVEASYLDLLCGGIGRFKNQGCTAEVAQTTVMGRKLVALGVGFNAPEWLVAVDAWLETRGAK